MKIIPKFLSETWWGNVVLGILSAAIFYFLILRILLSTDLPMVAVVSDSMYHGPNDNYRTLCGVKVDRYQNFTNFWDICKSQYDKFNITKEQFKEFPASNGFDVGDMPIIRGVDEYKVGDVIVYSTSRVSVPIIHRIVKINEDNSYQTKGDNNPGQNPYELSVAKQNVHGKVIFIIPKL